MSLSYRAGTPDDAAAIDRVFRASFCQTFAHLYRPEDLAAFLGQFTLDAWGAELSDPAFAFLVAEADGGIVGYAKLGPLKLDIEPSGTARLLSQLYVLPSHAGAGIGGALLDRAVEQSRRAGIAELYLTVFVDNRRARRFYARYGFEAVGRYDFMVGSQADEDIIMRKVL
ncbi:MAG TPA: GNAT family N-acetyltransferase [Sphingomicrobium sp.]|nr:GNAT family N-acetyltransferase [Sphingomicrobium sp.]